MLKRLLPLGCILAAAWLAVQPAAANQELNALFGAWKGRTYLNPYFGFSLPVPENLHIIRDGSSSPAAALDQELRAIKDPLLREQVKVRETLSVKLVHVSEYKLNAKVPFNANLVVIAMRRQMLPQVKTPEQFLETTLQTLKQAGIRYDTSEPQKVKLGGRDFTRQLTEMNMRNQKLTQDTYCRFEKDFILSVTTVYATPEQAKKLQAALQGLAFR